MYTLTRYEWDELHSIYLYSTHPTREQILLALDLAESEYRYISVLLARGFMHTNSGSYYLDKHECDGSAIYL